MKIAIFAPGANGDILYSSSVLKYRDEIWKDATLVWFCMKEFLYLFDHQPNVITRLWDENYNLTVMTPDYKLDPAKKNNYEATKDLDEGYFVYPSWMPVGEREKLGHLSVCPRFMMGLLNKNMVWRPSLAFCDEDRQKVKNFYERLQKGRKNIMIETHHKSDQSRWNNQMTVQTIGMCREILGDCNFIFASNIAIPENVPNKENVFPCSDLTLRDISLLHDYCDLFIGVSSGISVAVSCWHNKPVQKIQYCSGYWASTFPITDAPMELVSDHLPDNMSRLPDGTVIKVKDNDFYRRLRLVLKKI